MIEHVRGYSLTSPIVAVIAWSLLAVSIIVLLMAVPKKHRVKAISIVFTIAAVLGVASYVEILVGFGVPADQLSVTTVASSALFIAALMLFIWICIRAWRRFWTIVPVLTTLLAALLIGNQAYGLFPDINSLDLETPYKEPSIESLPQYPSVSLEEWKPQLLQPVTAEGSVVKATPPTPQSGFHPRESYVYLPPAWFTNPRPALPVIVVMPGIPGTTDQWFDQAEIGLVSHNYQRKHGGVSPIIVTADGTGGVFDNPVCTDSAKAKVQTYLTQDLPQWITDKFGADPNRAHWTIGGLSYGGTCAFQTILNNPGAYGNFFDFSGEITPNDGKSHETTVQDYFYNSEQYFREHNPEDLLKTHRYPTLRGVFVAGADDSSAQKDLRTLDKLARGAGINSHFVTVPGSHNFITWRNATRELFPTFMEWAGLPR